ncbi:MAG TPA: NADH:flavin oxidoreductase, partial [Armatimonadetes bacterium]|nr:NADH:flavin oxidoreductase [Armatimonadota bacterium]
TAKHLEALLNITRRAHRTLYGSDDGLLCGIQLTHSGRYSFQKPLIAFHHPVLDARQGLPSDYPILSDDYLERLEDAYVRATAIAAKVGFDFVDIKQCHGYLLSELLAAKTRPGRYGGSFENRTRFIRNVISKIRHEINDDIILASRINAYDGLAYEPDAKTGIGIPTPYPIPYLYGFGCDESNPLREDFAEPCQLVKLLYELGVQLINVSLGNPYTNPHIGRPFERPPIDGYETPEHPLIGVARHFRAARIIQNAVPDAIIVSTGYNWLRQFWVHAAVANIQTGTSRIAGVGRTAIAYPDFARDLMERGALDNGKVCLADSFCTALMRFKHHPSGQYPVGCVPRDLLYAPIYKDAINRRRG